MPTVLWFRRELRLADHPALLSAAEDGGRRHGAVPSAYRYPERIVDHAREQAEALRRYEEVR